MKSVLISIQPKWVEKICSGEKTIEVRKTKPSLDTPFKCYIYETKGLYKGSGGCLFNGRGKVIGEFVCDRIICSQAYFDSQGKNHLTNVFEEDIKRTCLTEYELWNYIAGKAVKANQMYCGYLWHISDLKIYDKPKELSEFCQECKGVCVSTAKKILCLKTKTLKTLGGCDKKIPIARPPQSWCYVEIGE